MAIDNKGASAEDVVFTSRVIGDVADRLRIKASGIILTGDGTTPPSSNLYLQQYVKTAAQWVTANPVLPVGVIAYESDTGIYRIADGVTAYLSLPANIRTCKQTAQVTNNASGTPTDVTGMAFSVQANHKYILDWMQPYQSDTATTGVGWRASAPALVAGTSGWYGFTEQGAAGTAKFWQTGSNSFGGLLSASQSVVSINTTVQAFFKGYFTPSADGVVQLRIQTEVDGTTVTAMLGGSGSLIDCGV